MNTSIQHPAPNGIIRPSGDSTQREKKLSTWRKPASLFSLAVLAGAIFLLCGAPAVRADRSPPGCTGSGLGISLYTSLPDVHIGDTIYYSVNVFNEAFPACDAGWTNPANAGAIVAWITTPDGVTNNITLRRTFLAPGQSDYYSNVVSYVIRSQDIRSDGTVRATADDQGDIHQNDTNSRGGGNQGVNTEVNRPGVMITAQCLPSVGENGAITFTGVVTNTGNNTLVGVVVTNYVNNQPYTVHFITNLAIGQTSAFSGSWIPLNPCVPSTAILSVRATDEFTSTPRTVTNITLVTCQNVLTAGIKVTKSCPVAPVAPGQLLTFSGSVSNTGNVTLTNVVVVNSQPSANTQVLTLPTLAPGVVAYFNGSYLAPADCSIADTLIATGKSVCGVAVSDTVSASCPILTTPQITVTAACPPTPVLPGGLLTYSGTVRNTGNITLTNVVVVSDRPAANTTVFTTPALAPGASANFTGVYDVPASACSVITTFSGRGKDICAPTTVTNTVSTTCTVTTAPAIVVTLTCPSLTASTGGSIIYTGTVRNSGNVTLNNVYVVNNQPAPNTPVIGPLTLGPGEFSNFTTTFTAPTDVCSVSSTVTATGKDNCTAALVTNTASATCPLNATPKIVVTQDCPVSPAIPGGLLTYSGMVRNTGNITITNVVVLNNLSGSTPVLKSVTLVPGGSATFTGSYLAPTNCSTTSISTATGQSICGAVVTDTVSSTCPILTAPQIAVTAVCPPTPVLPGGLLTYSGTVRNTGNISLTNVIVVSDRPAANTTVFTVPVLAPGASANFTGASTVPANACSVTTTFSGIGKDICTLATVTNSVSTTCAVTTATAISVTLACPVVPVVTGGPITYTGTVRNSGDVTLNSVTVVNSQSVPSTVLTVASLAPGATANFTATITAPIDACSVSSTVTARGSDACSAVMVTNTASATCPLLTTPSIAVTKACPLQPAAIGSVLVFSGTVTNTGNITLTNVIVINNQPAPNTKVFGPITLAPGTGTNFTGSYTTPLDVCSVTDSLIASGNDQCTGKTVSNTVSATCPLLAAPAIVVTQACPITPVVQGGILTYSGTVSNAGNITLTNLVVVNNWPVPNTVIFTAASLAPGATRTFTGSYQVPINCCVAWLTVQARGQGCDGVMVTDTDTGICTVFTSPQIVVTKVCPPTATRPGEVLQYSGTVSNPGNITLVNVTIENSQTGAGSPILGPIALAPGESVSYNASYIVPPDFCGTDTVTARGLDACTLLAVANNVTTTCPIITTPRIAVTQSCPPQPTPHSSQLIFSGTVSNPGNVTLNNVYVVSSQPGNNTPVIGPITLAPGASVNFTGSFTTPPFCCEIVNTLTARGKDLCTSSNVTATATAVCPMLNTPRITITKDCPAAKVPVGGLFVFSGSVSNSGDTILTNVYVVSSLPIPNTPVLGPIELAPGETKKFSGSYTVTTNSNPELGTVMARGMNTCQGVIATATSDCFGPVYPQVTISSVKLANGILTVTWKATPGVTYRLQYASSVQNPVWNNVPGDVTASGATASKNDAMGATKQRFYRVVVVQ